MGSHSVACVLIFRWSVGPISTTISNLVGIDDIII